MQKFTPRQVYLIPFWQSAPLLRLLLPLIIGIAAGWYLQPSLFFILTGFIVFLIATIAFSFFKKPGQLKWFGISLLACIICLGAWLVHVNDTRNNTNFIGKKYTDGDLLVATLQEPLNEKTKSYKAEASVEILVGNHLEKLAGNIIIYFQKDSSKPMPALGYGHQIIFKKSLQQIKNAGNPGGFDYQRYSIFQNLFYQVFLKNGEYQLGKNRVQNPFKNDLFLLRGKCLAVFKKYIPGETESGMAEALLIGYRNDLDREIVQQYTNTGVVHIIAISGMHLGLIYGLVMLLFKPFSQRKRVKLARALAVIAVLWIFSLLTGAAPSITRSAIMFTFLVLGQIGDKKMGIYNSLACSALLLLTANPFNLWDVGFQLSFSALLSIAIFASPIEKLWHQKYWLPQKIWQLNAATLAAQILTFPVVLFHFHQFPNLFLLTNLLAVPLSSLIIYALIALLAFNWVPGLNTLLGLVSNWLIQFMDWFIFKVNSIPFALTDGIYFSFPQAVIMLFFISAMGYWLLQKSKKAFVLAAWSFVFLIAAGTLQLYVVKMQNKLIVYNVPLHAAVDVIHGNEYIFYGDSVLLEDGFLQNFHLKPSRVQHQILPTIALPNVKEDERCIQFGNKKMIWVDESFEAENQAPIETDVALITGNPKLKLYDLVQAIHPKNIVADGTNSRYKIGLWQSQADSLHLQFHSTANNGAFEMDWR